ncbi:lipopolysaccharide biosynthesis protein [Nitrospira sp. NS4]|uniref:lipopolysaccharide biosynthesis protein n=1 Tax=Nitrospira sp. NS4 TaxID=3414498 RepID=UPI003C2ED3E5
MTFLKRVVQFLDRADGSLQRKAVRSGIWVGLSSAGVAVLSFARSIILARLLTPEIFGLMAVCSMAVRMIEIFTETGFGAALIHRQQRFEDARDTAFTLMVLRGAGLSVLAFFIAPWAAAFYEQPILDSLVAIVGISFVFTGCQNVNAIALQKELDFKRLTYLEQAGTALNFLVSVGLAYTLRSVWALVYAQIASAAINSILSFVIVPGRVRFRFDFAIAKELFQYGRFITGLVIVVFLTRELDNAVIGKLLGMEALGYYVIAYTLANIPSTYISKLLAKVLFPMFSKLQSDKIGLAVEYGRGIRLVIGVVVPVSVGIAVLAPEIVAALYGPQWAPAVAPLQILAVFGCFRALWMLNGYLYNAIGQPQIDFYVSLARLIVMGALIYPLAVSYGIVGASLAVTVPMVMQFIVGVFLSRRLIGVPVATSARPFAVAVLQGGILGAVLVSAKLFVTSDPIIGLAVLIGLGGVAFVILHAQEVLAAWRARKTHAVFARDSR